MIHSQATMMKTIRLLEQTPRNVAKIIAEKPLILVPIGTVEWHADHLPLGVDSLLSVDICDNISAQTRCIVAPLLACGICRDLQPERGYFGTIDTIQDKTLSNLVGNLLLGYAKMGFTKAVILSGHFEMEHYTAICEGIKQVPSIQSVFLTALDFLKYKGQELGDVTLTWPYVGDHAGEWETSMMLYSYPDLVHMEDAPETIELNMEGLPEYIRKRYPRRASQEYGRQLHTAIIAGGVERINEILGSF
jgi:creatinine amidohydrolase